MTDLGARAATAGELAKFRASVQLARLYLVIPQYASVATGRITTAPASNNKVTEVAWGNVTGLANVREDMTCYVGSSAGAYDKGLVRVRKTPTSGALYIGETSEIAWAAGDYLTVVNEFAPWPRHTRVSADGNTVYMDYDVEYTDQHTKPAPVGNMGADIVAVMTGSSITVTGFDASSAWVISGSIASVLWSFPGSFSSSNLATNTPSVVYSAPGTYLAICTFTTDQGTTWTGYRYVHVVLKSAPPITEFTIGGISQDYDGGGWSFDVTLYGQATTATVRDRARVYLVERASYQHVSGSIGIAGRENIVATGWIARETIVPDKDGGSVSFSVVGPHYWLNLEKAFPAGVQDSFFGSNGGVVDRWTRVGGLTIRKGLWHWLHWHTTLTRFTDITIYDDPHGLGVASAEAATLWGQVQVLSTQMNISHAVFDSLGRLFVLQDLLYLPTDERAAKPVVLALLPGDWIAGSLQIERRVVPDSYYAEVSGVYYSLGLSAPVGAMSPGDVPRTLGQGEKIYANLVMGTPVEAQELASLVAGADTGQIGTVSLTLSGNLRLFDAAMHCYATLSLAAGDTPRGIALTNYRLIPRSIQLDYDESGSATSTITFVGSSDVTLPAESITFPGEEEPVTGGGGGGGDDGETGGVPPEPPGLPPEPPEIGLLIAAIVATATDVQTTADISVSSPTWASEL